MKPIHALLRIDYRRLAWAMLVLLAAPLQAEEPPSARRLLYVAVPGVRNYLEYGGHGLLVFDIEQQHRFVKRNPTGGLDNTPLVESSFPVRLRHAESVTTVRFTPARSEKHSLGVFRFSEGNDSYVEVAARDSTGLVVVDAVIFRPERDGLPFRPRRTSSWPATASTAA